MANQLITSEQFTKDVIQIEAKICNDMGMIPGDIFRALFEEVNKSEPCKQCGELECKFECINSKY